MGVKEYELPNGRKAVFEFDENGVGKITLEAMDLLMGLIKADIVKCGECKHRDPEDKKCDCGMFERQGCIFPVSDDYFCKYGERRSDDNTIKANKRSDNTCS